MNSITQQPVNIGPIPRVVRLEDSGTTLALFVALACVVSVNCMRRKR